MKTRTLPGLNIQAPWATRILKREKTVETRFYPLSKKYIGKEMAVIETPGKMGDFKSRIVGTVVFGESFQYKSQREFYSDAGRHLVRKTNDSVNWESGGGKKKWGWPIIKTKKFQVPRPIRGRRGIIYAKEVSILEG